MPSAPLPTRWLALAAALLAGPAAQAQAPATVSAAQRLGLLPLPRAVQVQPGTYALPAKILILARTPAERNVAELLREQLTHLGRTVTLTTSPAAAQIKLATAPGPAPEGYRLAVDRAGIRIAASTGAGLFYGTQTLLQLLPARPTAGVVRVPYVQVQDEPAFGWRGAHLDVSRHFFSVAFLKKYIDLLAAYKLNTFHWHLTDDQGWRLEIKQYPRLTQQGAVRPETLIGAQQIQKPADYTFDGTPYGGYYTQAQVREVVAYAQRRYVTIVPEIEMPGHSVAVLAAYPELACRPGPYTPWTMWGVNEDIVCPSEATIQFFQNVLGEVAQLFPGRYVHIGGDEAPKARWKDSPLVQDIMRREGFTDVEQVQGWFNRRIEAYLTSQGKKLIGWDEILEGGISPGATVMSWRGEKGGIEAARQGHDVVMTPTTYVYLDYGQNPQPRSPDEPLVIGGYLPLSKVYSYHPLPAELTAAQQKHILGVQGNLWTEYVTTPEKAEYQLFPRMLAVAEVAWTPAARRDYADFLPRLGEQYAYLDQRQVNYRVPEPLGLDSTSVAAAQNGRAVFTLRSLVPGAQIRYTLDGKLPGPTTDRYTQPLSVPTGRGIRVRAVAIAPNGRPSPPAELLVR